MKKILMLLLMLYILTGCMIAGAIENVNTYKPDLNEEKTVSVGDTFFVHVEETIQKYNDAGGKPIETFTQQRGTRFDLVIVELNDQKIGLQYSEYMRLRGTNYYVSPMGGMRQVADPNWLIKQGFNQRFDYAIADKIIRFKGYEFEIVSVEKGQIKYKRVK